MSNQVYAVGGLVNVGPPVLSGNGAPSSRNPGQLGQSYFDKSTSPYTQYVWDGSNWEIGGGSGANEFDADSGTAIPVGGVINIVGTNNVTTTASGNTITIDSAANGFPITPYVVGPVGEAGYQTIQAALTAANAAGGGIVYVQPGTYTENLTLFGNTQVVGVPGNSDAGTSGNSVIITGVHTPPTTGSFAFANIRLASATHIFSSAAAGSADLVILDCIIAVTNGFTFNLANWTGDLVVYNAGEASTNNGVVTNAGGATCFFISATMGAGTGQTMSTSGPVTLEEVDLNCPWNAATGSVINCNYAQYTQTVTAANNSTGSFSHCRFSTGATAALTMSSSAAVSLTACVITTSNDPAISGAGAGTLTLTDISFTGNSNIANTLTLDSGIIRGGNFISQYVVGSAPDAQYQTIQAALTAANAAGGGIVYVQSGSYTENLTLYGNTQVVGIPGNSDFGTSGNSVVITGVHTPPDSGSFSFNNIRLVSTTHIFSSAAAGTAALFLENCIVVITSGFTFNVPNWTGFLGVYNCGESSTNNGVVSNAAGATCFFISATMGAGTGQTMSTTGPVTLEEVDLNCPWNAATGTTINCNYAQFSKTVTAANNSTGSFTHCNFSTGATAALTMSSSASIALQQSVVTSSNSPAITGAGAGVLSVDAVVFTSNSDLAATLNLSSSNLTRSNSFSTTRIVENISIFANQFFAGGTNTDVGFSFAAKGSGNHELTNLSGSPDIYYGVTNTEDVSGNAGFRATAGNGEPIGTGDAYNYYSTGGQSWIAGIDNSDSNSYVISASGTLGTTNAARWSTSGALTNTAAITATTGAITATNGNLVLGTAGNKLSIATGANASTGQATLTNGTVTVNTTAVTASSLIQLTRGGVGATGANDLGMLSVGTIVAGTSFDINAWTVTNATALQTDDQSVVNWLIIN